jgi:glycosyltransferase involved in cell wall biosynthesis
MSELTIITTTHNVAPFIDEYFASLGIQTYQNFDLEIVDDGSDDKTVNCLVEHLRTSPIENISLWLSEKHIGRAKALEEVMGSEINTPYFCWVDADDYLPDPNALKRVMSLIKEDSGHAGYYTDCQLDYGPGVQSELLTPGRWEPSRLTYCCYFKHLVVYDTFEFYSRLGKPFSFKEKAALDYEIISRLTMSGATFQYLPTLGYTYRMNRPGSMSETQSVEQYLASQQLQTLLKGYLKDALI